MDNRLSYMRRKSGMKQYDLAKRLEVSPSLLCKIEKGIQEPTEYFMSRCAEIFNENIEAIFNTGSERKGNILTESVTSRNNIWPARVQKNIKQNRLAEQLGCSPSYLSKIEKGLQEPNDAFKKKCAKILKIKEKVLFPDNQIIV